MGKYKVNTRTGKFDLVGRGGGGGGDYELTSPNGTIEVTETSDGHAIDIETTLKNKLITAYESQIGRNANNLSNYNKVELFRIYYDKNGATGRNASFDVFYRTEYDIVSVGRFSVMCGYAASKGGDYLDFYYIDKYDKDGADIINKIKACRIQKGRGMTQKDLQGCVVIYMETTNKWDSCSFMMGSRYADDNLQTTGGANYDYINTKFTLPSESIGTPLTASRFPSNVIQTKFFNIEKKDDGSYGSPSQGEVNAMTAAYLNGETFVPTLCIYSNEGVIELSNTTSIDNTLALTQGLISITFYSTAAEGCNGKFVLVLNLVTSSVVSFSFVADSAENIKYDNEQSGMLATTTQEAIDEIANNLGVISTLTKEDWEAIRAAGGIQSEVDTLAEVLDGYINDPTPTEEWEELDLNDSTLLSGWWIDGDCKWYSSSSCTMRYIAIPPGATKVRITANNDYATFGAIVKSVNTGSRVAVDTAEGVSGRITVLKTESSEFEIEDDAKYIVYSVSSNGTYNQVPSKIECYVLSQSSLRSGTDGETATINKVKDDIERIDADIEDLRSSISGDSAPTNYYRVGVHFGTPSDSIDIVWSDDSDATSDEAVVNHGQLIQIGKYFYMFYLGLPIGATSETQYYILTAYSDDGQTWHRGFPPSVTPPVSGTNRLLSESGLIEHCIVEVPDHEYPYRLLCNKIVSSSSQSIRIYKSSDGINYTFVKTILSEKHDSQMSAVCKGNTIIIYTRIWDSAHTNRQVGAMTIDLDGNIVKPLHLILGDYLYNSASLPIDLKRELFFPTWYIGVNVSTQQDMHLECYQKQDEQFIKLNTNINGILNSDEYWALVCPGSIAINGQKYICVNAWKRHHYTVTGDINKMGLRLVPITIV